MVNPNKEVEQGKEQITGTEKGTRNSLPAQALWETDHFDNTVKKVEKPKATRAKPKTSCPFSPDDPIPPEYLEYAQAKHPSINAQTEFTKFVNFHLSGSVRISVSGEVIPGAAQRGCPLYLRCSMPDLMR